MLKLLCVTAHPDDEAGCFGGVLSKYSGEGVECAVLCLTGGERAANRAGATDDEALKAIRRREFADSCHHLGVTTCELWEYPDGNLFGSNFAEVAGRIAAFIRRFRPDVVVTFGPEGFVTAHPDHGMAGLFTQAAFQFAARALPYSERHAEGLPPWQAQKLYYCTTVFSLAVRPAVSLSPVTARIDVTPFLERKNEAFALHLSQRPLLPIFVHAQQQAGNEELFHLAATREITPLRMETDLFDGLR